MKKTSNKVKSNNADSNKSDAKQKRIFKKLAGHLKYVSTFLQKNDKHPGRTKPTLEMFQHDVRTDKDGEMYSASKFEGTRGNDNFVSANAMFNDYDKGNPTIEEICAVFPDTLKLIHTTHSHTLEKPRYRVVLPLSRRVKALEHAAIGRALKEILPPKLRKCLDKSCFERARAHYLPACPPEQADNAKSLFFDGSPLDADELIAIGKEIPSEKAVERGTTSSKKGDRPGDDFMRRHTIVDVILKNEWTHVKENYYAKPGDTSGEHHAKLYKDGVYVYSTEAPVPKGYYDAFAFFVFSSYGGDFPAATSELRKKGYGGAAPSDFARSERLFVSPTQLLEMQSDNDSLIGNLIRQGTTGQLFGPTEAGKSFVGIDMALSVATGKDWHGYKCQQGLVVYCVGEGYSGFSNRIRAWVIANDNLDISLFRASRNVINFDGNELKIASAELKLYEQETGRKVSLIIIDTLARHLDGDENSATEMTKFVRKVDGLRGAFPGSSAIIVHHSGHGNGERARGSSALKAALDFEISCKDYALTFTKMKEAAKPEPIDFKLDVVEVGINADGEPVTSCVVSYGKKPERSSKKAPTGTTGLSDIDRTAVKALVLASVKRKKQVDGKYGSDDKTWRETFYDLREKNDISRDALKKSFSRAKDKLRELGHTEVVDDVVFLTDPERQAEIKKKIKSANE